MSDLALQVSQECYGLVINGEAGHPKVVAFEADELFVLSDKACGHWADIRFSLADGSVWEVRYPPTPQLKQVRKRREP